MKTFVKVGSCLLGLALLLVCCLLSISPYDQSGCVDIQSGQSKAAVFHQLHDSLGGLPSFSNYLAFRFHTWNQVLRAGEYCFDGSHVHRFYDDIASGKVRQHSFQIVPGETWTQIISKLKKQNALSFDVDLDARHLKTQYEGRLSPNTYAYTKGESVSSLLNRAESSQMDGLYPLWESRDESVTAYSYEQLLVVASLIEKESLPDDKAMIAGVIFNRISAGMRLQIDASVVYAFMDDYKRGIKISQLIKRYHPANTYKIKGLPPSPIGMFSVASFKAATQPEHHDAYYYVFDGHSHVFSKTFSDHKQVIKSLHNRPNSQDK